MHILWYIINQIFYSKKNLNFFISLIKFALEKIEWNKNVIQLYIFLLNVNDNYAYIWYYIKI